MELPIETTVCDIEPEDYIKYQQIEFDIIKGYYWDGAKDYTIQDKIRYIFNKRLECKKQGSSLQAVYKLIMNSCYGKTIQKPVKYDRVFKKTAELERYWHKNYNRIVESVQLEDSDIHMIKVHKQIDNQFNLSLLGVHILAMSKRIMNEVMCLAYDLGIRVYYQDTDSMHVEMDQLDRLSDAYRDKYNRELIGSDLGQFHSDFEPINGSNECPYAIESYFIGKKLYIDKLTDSSNNVGYHVRGKGLTQKSIWTLTNESYNGDPMMLYKDLYDGHQLQFDLTSGQPSFNMKNDYTVSSRTSFLRCVQCKLSEGLIEEYFTI